MTEALTDALRFATNPQKRPPSPCGPSGKRRPVPFRNTGVKAASGKYICFVASDDIVLPTYCEDLLNTIENYNCDFSVCAVHRFADGSQPHPNANSGSIRTAESTELLRLQFNRQSEFGVINKMFRKELFDSLFFMPGKIHEDVIFSADLVKNLHHGVRRLLRVYLYRILRKDAYKTGHGI